MTTTDQSELVIKQGTATPDAPPEAPPADVRESAEKTKEDLFGRFEGALRQRLEQRETAKLSVERTNGNVAGIGEPTVGPYVAFDLYAFTPIQFFNPPPYRPSKIIASGEWAVIYAVMFVNPAIDMANGFAVQPTVQLSQRNYRVSMEQINLTDVTNGPDQFRPGVFAAPAPAFTRLEFWFRAPVALRKPLLYEANLIADILNPVQPYAAFASTIVDADTGRVQENIPLRYLVYPK